MLITDPVQGMAIKAGTTYTIVFETNLVTNVYIDVSYDGGLTYETITQQGGILLESGRTTPFGESLYAGFTVSESCALCLHR